METQVRQLLNERGMTSKALADRLDVAPQYLNNIISGRSGASLQAWQRVADALGVAVWQLFAPRDEYILPTELEARISKAVAQREADLRRQLAEQAKAEQEAAADQPDLILTDPRTGAAARYRRLPDITGQRAQQAAIPDTAANTQPQL